jgi:YegS/Rv2252/BmrU family lipid kinase
MPSDCALESGTPAAASPPNRLTRAVLICNPAAGGSLRNRWATRQLEQARKILSGAGIETSLLVTREPGDATRLTREFVTEGCQVVIVAGGDGTINEVVNGMVGSDIPLAILPCGTANVLAKELGIPWDVRRAAELIPRLRPRRVALGLLQPLETPAAPGSIAGTAAPRYFLCLGGAGPDGAIVYSLDHAAKLRSGILAYWLEGFRQLIRYRFPHFRVSSEGRELAASLVVVGRTKHYGGPFQITTGASLFKDEFEVVAATTRNPLVFLSYLPGLWFGYLRGLKSIHCWKTTALRCEVNRDGAAGDVIVHAQVDGEPAGRLGVEFRIVPSALTLLVPEGAQEKA